MELWSLFVVIAALGFLMFMAYKGHSVILFAPIAAMGAVLLTAPALVAPSFTGLFMDKMVGFIKNYFPVFLLGAIFGKLMEVSGFAKSIVTAVIKLVGARNAMLTIVLTGAILTYGGVSLFVVVFAVYPFAAEMFRQGNIPKRLIPGTIALGAFTFTMDAIPGTPQIQNIIPTTFFKTDAYAAPILGIVGGIFVFAAGMAYLEWQRRKAVAAGEGYGENHINEPTIHEENSSVHPLLALLPLLTVGIVNFAMTRLIPIWFAAETKFDSTVVGKPVPVTVVTSANVGIWAVIVALLLGILVVVVGGFKTIKAHFAEDVKPAIAGALLATMNTASEYGFGAVIASLAGFKIVADGLGAIPNPLVREAVTVTSLAGITGSASGGMSIALGAMADQFIAAANQAGIPMEVLHRVASMASGGMDTLPHNGAVITLLFVTGLTHKSSYKDIFAMTVIKTLAVFVIIGLYYATGLV
ncbi:MAG TPA: GntP family permease [Propionibacteriaceae bacterium]|nr:GntP family permease [Propionibacteriaceae bacterium]HPZ49518.1 GntP family permease [Propionibacteriaceae bacterium]HQE32700.1 GntP family permease [Propionibacteriaceae bacterium]